MKESCLFCSIVKKKENSYVIWEDKYHLAFLTPFPNTEGFTVLITKEHYDSYVFDLEKHVYLRLCEAAKSVAKLLDNKLDVQRTGIIFEGMGINHVHAKLIPMHGIPKGKWKPIQSLNPEYFEPYRGFLSSKDGPKMKDKKLLEIQNKITNCN